MDGKKKSVGDLYNIIKIEDKSFEIRYGYYDKKEMNNWDPEPIFPDLLKNPVYTQSGKKIVTSMQDICKNFVLKPGYDNTGICAECNFYCDEEKNMIGICTYSENNN